MPPSGAGSELRRVDIADTYHRSRHLRRSGDTELRQPSTEARLRHSGLLEPTPMSELSAPSGRSEDDRDLPCGGTGRAQAVLMCLKESGKALWHKAFRLAGKLVVPVC